MGSKGGGGGGGKTLTLLCLSTGTWQSWSTVRSCKYNSFDEIGRSHKKANIGFAL